MWQHPGLQRQHFRFCVGGGVSIFRAVQQLNIVTAVAHGVKGFGTYDMEVEEISHYFVEFFSLSADCRYSNCTHTHEPGCAVLAALERGELAPSRYQSYLSMLEDKEEGKYRAAF